MSFSILLIKYILKLLSIKKEIIFLIKSSTYNLGDMEGNKLSRTKRFEYPNHVSIHGIKWIVKRKGGDWYVGLQHMHVNELLNYDEREILFELTLCGTPYRLTYHSSLDEA